MHMHISCTRDMGPAARVPPIKLLSGEAREKLRELLNRCWEEEELFEEMNQAEGPGGPGIAGAAQIISIYLSIYISIYLSLCVYNIYIYIYTYNPNDNDNTNCNNDNDNGNNTPSWAPGSARRAWSRRPGLSPSRARRRSWGFEFLHARIS